MSRVSRYQTAFTAVLLVFAASACGSSAKSAAPADSTTTTGASSAVVTMTGSLDVFAAASLTGAFNTVKTNLATSDPALESTYNFAGTQALVTQIQQGAPADVFASADEKSMQTLVDADLVGAPQVFAHSLLQIAVAPGNPENITSLADLEKPGVTLVLADESVPAGKYARQAFTKAGLPEPKPVSNELDVKSTISKLVLGEVDAAVVYVTDVKAAGDKVTGVAIPTDQNVEATYPIAVVKATKNRSTAQAYVDYVVSGGGQRVLQAAGFLPPT